MALPSGYKQLEYIQSSGSQYIDTGYKPNSNTRVVCDFQLTKAYSSSTAVFGARDNTTNLLYVLYHIGTNKFRTDYYGTYLDITVSNDLSRLKVDKNKNVTSFEGGNSITNTAATASTPYNVFLFATNVAGTATSQSSVKIYSCKIYDNGTLVRDYIPCKNASDTVGLWDDVNGAFYANTGSGTFTAGPVVDPMAPHDGHNTNIGNVAREIEGGTVLIGGVLREIESGMALINGVARELAFGPSECTITTTGEGASGYMYVAINGTNYYKPISIVVPRGTEITLYANNSRATGQVWVNGTRVAYSSPVTYRYTVKTNISIAMTWKNAVSNATAKFELTET